MKRIGFSAAFAGFVLGAFGGANAAYPVYQGYQATNAQGQVMYLPGNAGTTQQVFIPGAVQQQQQVIIPTVQGGAATSATPTRITGALPRVGSTATKAGRQYYQPADYDRLADSGLYIGISAAYTASVMGSMGADYTGEQNAWFVPGAFKDADFSTDTVIPLQLSVGAAINNDIRVDFSYLRYSGIDYPNQVDSSDGAGGFVVGQVDGGAITANTTMLNVYYNIDSYTGYLAGGALRPYIGAGVGLSLNTISDYVVYDGSFYAEVDDPTLAGAGELTGISDVYAYHNGGTTEQFAFMLEGGLTTELDGGLKLDFFVRYANLGKVKTSGSIVVSQTEWLGDGTGVLPGEYEAPYDSVFHYTNWYESGRLSVVDVGVRLRLQF